MNEHQLVAGLNCSIMADEKNECRWLLIREYRGADNNIDGDE